MGFFSARHVVVISIVSLCGALAAAPDDALIRLFGSDFQGGAKDLHGTVMHGLSRVNYVYAAATGQHSTMSAQFQVSTVPDEPLFLHVKALDDDAAEGCAIAIELNGKVLFEGKSQFPSRKWSTRQFPIPPGTVKQGSNTLVISNREPNGTAGMPPWFMVGWCVVGGEKYNVGEQYMQQFHVKLPDKARPFPEPLAPGQEPGFKWRGTKGWLWTTDQYLSEIPVLAKYKMNFLMNCYGSMLDIEHYRFGDPNSNRWWEDLPQAKKDGLKKIADSCRKHGVTFCFGMNPNISTKRIVKYESKEDIDALYKHYDYAQSLGVKWFNISLDDISEGIDAAGQAKAVNEVFHRLRAKDPDANMIFCPTFYWGDGTEPKQKAYLEILAKDLDKDIYLFWTGDSVVGKITRKGAETFKGISQHRIFLWDNYPVNDAQPTMHLGPVITRDADLNKVIDGYMCNPLHTQTEANRIPMLTCGDYAYNPGAYEPMRSIGQAIYHLGENDRQRAVLKELVEQYPGMLICGTGATGYNPVRDRISRIREIRHAGPIVDSYLVSIEQLLEKMKTTFPDSYGPEKKTIAADIEFIKKGLAAESED